MSSLLFMRLHGREAVRRPWPGNPDPQAGFGGEHVGIRRESIDTFDRNEVGGDGDGVVPAPFEPCGGRIPGYVGVERCDSPGRFARNTFGQGSFELLAAQMAGAWTERGDLALSPAQLDIALENALSELVAVHHDANSHLQLPSHRPERSGQRGLVDLQQLGHVAVTRTERPETEG